MSFSTYAIDKPRFGGPIRISALHRLLRARSWKLKHLCVTEREDGEASEVQVIFRPTPAYLRALEKVEGRPDVDAASFLTGDVDRLRLFCEEIDAFDPDVLMLEQPWLWPAVKVYLSRSPSRRRMVVYSSQNVEEQLIEPLLSGLKPHNRRRLIELTAAMERDLIARAEVVIAVSEADATVFRAAGTNTIVAPNGVWPRVSPGDMDYWSKEFHALSFALFVASAHPPNATGFVDMVGPDLSYLAPDERVVVVGWVAWLLPTQERARPYRGVNAGRLRTVGVLNDDGLSTMIELCKGFILPITVGGGTNLKTAEALYNRTSIVATSKAFRGFERFMTFPGVRICDDEESFKAAIVDMLRAPKAELSYTFEQELALNGLVWSATLAAVPEYLETAWQVGVPKQDTILQEARRWGDRHGAFEIPIDKCLMFGWHNTEDNGVWSSEFVSGLSVPALSAADVVLVQLSLRGFQTTSYPNTVSLFSGNDRRFQAVVSCKDDHFKAYVFLRRNEITPEGNFEILVQSSSLLNPERLHLLPDRRHLGLFLTKIVMRDDVWHLPSKAVRRLGQVISYEAIEAEPALEGWSVFVSLNADLEFSDPRWIPHKGDTAAFLDSVYRAILGRPVDHGGLQTHAGLKSNFSERAVFVEHIAASEESRHPYQSRLVIGFAGHHSGSAIFRETVDDPSCVIVVA